MGIQVYLNEELRHFPRGDNYMYEIPVVKYNDEIQKSSSQ